MNIIKEVTEAIEAVTVKVTEGKIGLPRANPRGRLRSPSYVWVCTVSSVLSSLPPKPGLFFSFS